MLCKYFGQLCLILVALLLVPLMVSLIFGDTISSILRHTIVISGLTAFGT
jgi:hypothetical protein